ncbi:hypothetical protein V5F77_05760 [Xanthobacter sp. DSM 24535]|uniref:hypothetical protein n=1 Tax=Roseixanthobacter psychrophilus TaxID=3119917 RepID=UPI00372814F4
MAVRALLLVVAAGFLWIGAAFLAICLYQALNQHYDSTLAALFTALAGFVVAGLFGVIAVSGRRSQGMAPLSLGAFASVTRVAERHPIATVAVAALIGVGQALLFGRRR